LVAIPTPDILLVYPFEDPALPGADRIAQRMASLAADYFDMCPEKRRISRNVYVSHADKALALEKFEAAARA
jgi:hypothetical protein